MNERKERSVRDGEGTLREEEIQILVRKMEILSIKNIFR